MAYTWVFFWGVDNWKKNKHSHVCNNGWRCIIIYIYHIHIDKIDIVLFDIWMTVRYRMLDAHNVGNMLYIRVNFLSFHGNFDQKIWVMLSFTIEHIILLQNARQWLDCMHQTELFLDASCFVSKNSENMMRCIWRSDVISKIVRRRTNECTHRNVTNKMLSKIAYAVCRHTAHVQR